MTLHDTDLAQAEERIYRLAERCSLAEEQRDYYKSAFMAWTRVWAETLEERDQAREERDHARDLAARLAAKQPVRPVPDSLAEAVLGAECAVWIDGPGGSL